MRLGRQPTLLRDRRSRKFAFKRRALRRLDRQLVNNLVARQQLVRDHFADLRISICAASGHDHHSQLKHLRSDWIDQHFIAYAVMLHREAVALAADPVTREWIERYTPTASLPAPDAAADTTNLLHAAMLWHDVKKHWCIEVQRLRAARVRLAGGA